MTPMDPTAVHLRIKNPRFGATRNDMGRRVGALVILFTNQDRVL